MRVHQFHPTLAPTDAMSNHVFALRKKIRHWGYDSFAYAVEAKPGVADVRSYRRLFRDVQPEDLLIVHFSMGSEVIDQLVKIPARRVLVYHNITPPEFFSGINPHAAAFARLGLRQLSRIIEPQQSVRWDLEYLAGNDALKKELAKLQRIANRKELATECRRLLNENADDPIKVYHHIRGNRYLFYEYIPG